MEFRGGCMGTLADVKVIDTDTHVTEPPDVWTSRLAAKWADVAPRVELDWDDQPRWRIGQQWLTPPAYYAHAGSTTYPPFLPTRLETVDAGSYDPAVRLERMNEYGIHAAVLYPNLIGFETPAFRRMGPEISLACVQAYNDFISDFSATDPARLVPITMPPFWDVDSAVAEVERCAAKGHKGVLWGNKYEQLGLPGLSDPHWDPVYAAARDCGMSMNFHIGFQQTTGVSERKNQDWLAQFTERDARETVATQAVMMMMSNGTAIAALLTGSVLDRFPTLKFVSVESGFGYLPYLLESLDWHWKGYGLESSRELLPSEYFRRQCYGTFWFEVGTLDLLRQYPDNFMFETDYPHPTSMSPGPASPALRPADHIATHYGHLPEDIMRKALYSNAAGVYQLDGATP
jgi:uncharacterized protein